MYRITYVVNSGNTYNIATTQNSVTTVTLNTNDFTSYSSGDIFIILDGTGKGRLSISSFSSETSSITVASAVSVDTSKYTVIKKSMTDYLLNVGLSVSSSNGHIGSFETYYNNQYYNTHMDIYMNRTHIVIVPNNLIMF